jgi:hypothetical protein
MSRTCSPYQDRLQIETNAKSRMKLAFGADKAFPRQRQPETSRMGGFWYVGFYHQADRPFANAPLLRLLFDQK